MQAVDVLYNKFSDSNTTSLLTQKLLSWCILVTPTHTDLGQRYDADE